MSNVSMALVRNRKTDIGNEITRWQRNGLDKRDPARWAKMNAVYHGLINVEHDIVDNSNLSLHGLGLAVKYDGIGETKQQRADRLRMEKLARQDAVLAAKQARQDAARGYTTAEKDKQRAQALAIATLKYNRQTQNPLQPGYDAYGNPVDQYGNPLNQMPYDPYSNPYGDNQAYQDTGAGTMINYYNTPPSTDTSPDEGDDYGLPPAQLPQISTGGRSGNANSIYADYDSGGIYDAIGGGFGELGLSVTSQSQGAGAQKIADAGSGMVLLGAVVLAGLYFIGHQTKRR